MANTQAPDQEEVIENTGPSGNPRAAPPGEPKLATHKRSWWKRNWWKVVLGFVLSLFGLYAIAIIHVFCFEPDREFELPIVKAIAEGLTWFFSCSSILFSLVELIAAISPHLPERYAPNWIINQRNGTDISGDVIYVCCALTVFMCSMTLLTDNVLIPALERV